MTLSLRLGSGSVCATKPSHSAEHARFDSRPGHSYTSPGHPQTNGKVEQLNHELVQRLQCISTKEGHQHDKWDQYLPQALLAFHAHKNQCEQCLWQILVPFVVLVSFF